jgi:hypothetical protein
MFQGLVTLWKKAVVDALSFCEELTVLLLLQIE